MGEIFVNFIIFYLKCVFYYPFLFAWKAAKFVHDRIVNRDPPVPTRDLSRPPTPAETAQAQTQLKIAHSLIEAARANDYGILGNLEKAAKALQIARNMDAHAQVPAVDGKGAMTVDSLSGYALFVEAHYFAHSFRYEGDWQRRMHQNKYQRQGLEAIDKAIRYDPRSSMFWAVKARLHKNLEQRPQAREAAQRAVELDRNNADALALLGQVQ